MAASFGAGMEETFKILWRDIGCPIGPGLYPFAGKLIRVRQHHIDAAAENPDAVCTVVCDNPLAAVPSYALTSIDPDLS